MNKRNFKLLRRLFAAVMALAMLVSMVPMGAVAAELAEEELLPAVVEVEAEETAPEVEEETVEAEEEAAEAEPAPVEEEEVAEIAPLAADGDFELWFNPDGATAVTAGQQGEYPVFAGQDMAAKSNKITVGENQYFSVQGSANAQNNGANCAGNIPDSGAYLEVKVPAAGTLTLYGFLTAGKAFYGVNKVDGAVVLETADSFPNSAPYVLDVKQGDDLFFYAKGSKAQFVGVSFTAGQGTTEPTDPGTDTEEPADPDAWQFKAFGTSTSGSVNTVGEGASINGKVTLNSCTSYEDGSINKKGGKFVADSPADGVSFYYTTIDPTTTNFYLQADVTIDYQNPALDGQEGFALQIRDTINGSGSYFSNTASVTGTKLPVDGLNGTNEQKDVIGTRNYTGIIDAEDAAVNEVKAYRQGFTDLDEDGMAIPTTAHFMKKGETYRVSLEKTAYGYVSTMYDIESGAILGQYTMFIGAKDSNKTSVSSYADLDDPMSVQEKNTAYVALATARGCNATFSNIIYKTSKWTAKDWQPQPTVYVEPAYTISSPATVAEDEYNLVFKANADGKATISVNGEVADEDVAIQNGVPFTKAYPVSGDTTFAVKFTPNPDFKFSVFEKLSSYETKTVSKRVTLRKLGKDGVIYVAPNGYADNQGTSFEDAVDIFTGTAYASAGQTICLKGGEYDMSGKELIVERGRDGSAEAPITMAPESGYATLNFGRTGRGFTLWGSWWHISKINVCYSTNGVKGMQVAGHNNVIERCNFFNNGNTGLQISGTSAETKAQWPSNNTILNCTSINNSDKGYEDADGFAAKLTVGDGNVFDGCIAAYNADDGWDLFAKAASGSIGMVTIKNSLAYRNGYIWAEVTSKSEITTYAPITCDEDGTLTIDKSLPYVDAGNGNGFKMGGTNLPGGHTLRNSISYENKAKGIDSNSCPDIKAYDSTSFNNKGYNVAMYTNNKSATTGYAAQGVISFRQGTTGREQFTIQGQNDNVVHNSTTFLCDGGEESKNTAAKPVTVSADWFQNLDTSVEPARNADGSINMHGLLLLKPEAMQYDAGARGAAWGQKSATIWAVGDSTVSPFNDKYYLPREGYGEELASYFNADVYNLAVSGASSKDFLGMAQYETLMKGSATIPALGDAQGEKYLVIGFGHNDQKTEAARFTSPVGDYTTEGSFAKSLYDNYVKPALDAGVTPVLCTPIVRLTTENTAESYNSASGHITETVVIGDTTFPGGDYAQAIRDLAAALGDKVILIDLTDATMKKNIELGEQAQFMHAFTGAKKNEDGTLTGTGLDKTHTNSWGAKMNAYLMTKLSEGTSLAQFVKGKGEPAYDDFFADAINGAYVPIDYNAPTEEQMAGSILGTYTDADGRVWNSSIFGDVGGQTNIKPDGDFSAVTEEDGSITLKVKNNRGKIAGSSDGYNFFYTRLPAGTPFTLTATATVKHFEANNQVSYGLMARDDLYIDTNVSSTMGDYVAAATRNQGAVNCYARKSSALFSNEGAPTYTYTNAGDVADLKIVGTADGFTLTYGENEIQSAGFDFALTGVDSDYIYVGFYVTRNAEVNFSNVKLVADVKEEPTEPTEPTEPEEKPEDKPTEPTKPTKPTQPAKPAPAVSVKKVSINSAKRARKRTIKVRWKKVANVSGYQIQYATKKNFKNAKTFKASAKKTVAKTPKSLKKKTKYYVRIRAYKTVSGKKYYSPWSKILSVKTK